MDLWPPFKESFMLAFKNYILGGIVDTTFFKMIKQVVCDDDSRTSQLQMKSRE